MKKQLLFLIMSFAFLSLNANAQFKNYKIKGGAQYQQLLPLSEFTSTYSFLGRAYIGFELTNILCLEIGAGYGQFNTDDDINVHNDNDGNMTESTGNSLNSSSESEHDHDVKTSIIPGDVRLRISPWARTAKNWNPYFYFGAGVLNYDVTELPDTNVSQQYNVKENGWAAIFPAGIGTEIKMSKNFVLDLSGGVTYSTTDLVNNFVIPDWKDGYVNASLGFTLTGNDDGNLDYDKDGLINSREEQIGTNPNNPDSDGDGLKDGVEVDQYKTNPLDKDTDDDRLMDGEEIINFNTNPLNKDTDSDKLSDYDEINTHRTLPNDSDTDDDMLGDGDEVLTHKTDPKRFDTDAGTVPDGTEVTRGSDPLNPNDDLPPPPPQEEMKIGAVIVLEGINFASGSYEIGAGSDAILEQAYNTLKNNPDIEVEISGYTDDRGSRGSNMTLSQNRAEAVKEWLVNKGISASRITAVGYGPGNPIASNDTEEGRYKNRRIEFKRIK